ncbi:MAG: dienelactone hydrolase family protein [Chloroflexi bacterium]|nr:dienelactone hydrolase family protein [Chloroflexota bacterium]
MAGEMVKFPSNGHEGEGYLATPASGSGPGVIVIQEWWGLVPHIKDVADRLASEGFVALAPDLYNGKTASEPDEAGKLMMELNIDEAARDMSGAVDYLIGLDAATGEKAGCVGFCVGGGLSMYLASQNANIGACVIYYGVLPMAQADNANIQAPILGHYADNDDFLKVDAVRELESNLKGLGKDVQFHIYEGTEHAFFNDSRPDVYNADAAKQSWERTLTFFRQHLG